MNASRFLTLIFFLICVFNTHAQLSWETVSIPMSDGEELSADVYLPNEEDTFPVVLIQTPYDKSTFNLALPLGVVWDLENSPYAFVVMDWRCFFESAGACVADLDRGQDGYDAVEWIASQDWCNGDVATWGPSALGNIQFQTAQKQPPHLVCCIPEVASPWTHFEQYFPGGVALSSYIQSLATLFGDNSLILENPNYNFLWQVVEESSMYPEDIEVPMLLVAGWYDHNLREDFIMLDTLRSSSPLGEAHKLLVGPWVHGGTGPAFVGSENQGELSYPEAAGVNIEIEREFLDHYLLGIDNGWEDRQAITYFQMGTDEWRSTDTWPPEGTEEQVYYMHAGLQWVPNTPSSSDNAISYTYDPLDPSPTVGGPTLTDELDQGPYDQVPEVESRSDLYAVTTAPMADSLEINGQVKVVVHFASNMPDSDIMLRLTDVDPEGHSYLLHYTAQRMRFRNGFTESEEEMMSPGTVYEVELTFPQLAHTVLPGHSLRVNISSSNYPQYNRNANTGGELYPNANPDTLVNPISAENVIHFSPFYDTRMLVPVNGQDTQVSEQMKQRLQVYPVPAKEILHVQSPVVADQYAVYDLKGQRVAYAEEINRSEFEVNVVALPIGAYVLKVQATDKSVWTTPFVKQ